MKLSVIVFILVLAAGVCHAAGESSMLVDIHGPTQPLRMGDTPTFAGRVTNASAHEMKGLVVYLSLVALEPGQEHPVDLEDWSAQKAVRIAQLRTGQSDTQDWPMRLIQAGRFGVAMTVVDPDQKQPIISDLLTFDIQSKPTLNSHRILPVAIGVPLILLLCYGFHWAYMKYRNP
jgi:hypothetical protein